MKLQQGKMQGTLELQSMLRITFQASGKLLFKLLLQRRDTGAQGEEECELWLQSLKIVLITLKGVPNAPCLSRSPQVISVQASYVALLSFTQQIWSVNVLMCCSWEVLVYTDSMRNLAWYLPCPSQGCKWDLTKRSFSFLLITAILLWALGESSFSWCADTVGVWRVKSEPSSHHWDGAREGEPIH